MKAPLTLANQLTLFFGLLFLLMGVFGALRIIYNLAALDKYPLESAIPSNLLITTNSFPGNYYQSESDCKQPAAPFYGPDGAPREPTEQERMNQKQFEESCLERIVNQRKNTKIADISQSAFMLFLGLGLLWTRKMIK